MVRASLIIIIGKNGITYEGNSDLVWYLNEKIKQKYLEEILELTVQFFQRKRKKGKINVIIVGDFNNKDQIIDKYKDKINFIFEKDIQRRITEFIK